MGIFIYSITFIQQRKFIRYAVALLLAGFCFHLSVLLFIPLYFILCRKYQKRIIELQENAHPGWNWWKLRKQVTELEDKKAEGIVEDIRRAAQSYMTV